MRHRILLAHSRQDWLENLACLLARHGAIPTRLTELESVGKTLETQPASAVIFSSLLAENTAAFCAGLSALSTPPTLIALIPQFNPLLEQALLDSGADDVLLDSYPLPALADRIMLRITRQVLGRRHHAARLGAARIDLDRLKAWRHDQPHPITRGQADLLRYFLAHRGRVITRLEVTDILWADSAVDPDGRNLDVQVGKLRRLIEADPKIPSLLLTVRGRGYVLGEETSTLQASANSELIVA
jgi:DNA-binding response OmpR family regulator